MADSTGPTFEPLLEDLTHTRNCPALTPLHEEDCVCGLMWRIRLRTEMEMSNAWRKRAQEAEACVNSFDTLRAALEALLDRARHDAHIIHAGGCDEAYDFENCLNDDCKNRIVILRQAEAALERAKRTT